MSKKIRLLLFLITFFPSAYAIYTYAYIGSYSRFLADDYCEAAVAQRLNLVDSLYYWYTHWHGGYSVVIFDALLPIIRTKGIPLVVPVVLLVWLFISIIAIYFLLPKGKTRVNRLLAAISLGNILIFTLLLLNPDIPQSLFWWTGMRAYTLPVIFATLYILIYAWFLDKTANRYITFLTGFLVIFIAGGFSETYTPVQFIFFLSLFGLEFLTKRINIQKSYSGILLGGLIGSLVALIVMIIAPGNSIRQSNSAPTPDLISIFQISLVGYFDFLNQLLTNQIKVTGVLGAVFACGWLGFHYHNQNKREPFLAPALFLTGLIFAFGCFIPAAYGTSAPPPYRSLSIATYFLTTFFMLAGFMEGQYLSNKSTASISWHAISISLFIISLCLITVASIFTSQTIFAKEADYVIFADKWDRIDRKILRAREKGDDRVIIPPMKNWARLGDVGEDPNYWINKCYSDYYGIQILTEHKTP